MTQVGPSLIGNNDFGSDGYLPFLVTEGYVEVYGLDQSGKVTVANLAGDYLFLLNTDSMTMSIGGDIIPLTSNTYNLGSPSYPFANVYADSINVTGLSNNMPVQTNGSGDLVTSNTFLQNLNFEGTSTFAGIVAFPNQIAGTLAQYNNSYELVSSNILPSGCSASSMTLSSPTLTGTIMTSLSSSSLVQTNSSSELVTSNTLPSGCSASSMSLSSPSLSGTVTTVLSASSIVQTNGSSQLVASNTLPSGSSATSMILTSPSISSPTVTGTISFTGTLALSGANSSNKFAVYNNSSGLSFNVNTSTGAVTTTNNTLDNGSGGASFTGTITTGLTASNLVQTNGSSQLVASNTLPSGCSASGMSLGTPTLSGTITTGLTSSAIVQTNSSSQLVASNTLAESLTFSGSNSFTGLNQFNYFLIVGGTNYSNKFFVANSSSVVNFTVNTSNGSSSTTYNTLDDGSGNMIVNNQLTIGSNSTTIANLQFSSTAGNNIYSFQSSSWDVSGTFNVLNMFAGYPGTSGYGFQLGPTYYNFATNPNTLFIIPGYKGSTATSGCITYDLPNTGLHYFWDNMEVNGTMACDSTLTVSGATNLNGNVTLKANFTSNYGTYTFTTGTGAVTLNGATSCTSTLSSAGTFAVATSQFVVNTGVGLGKVTTSYNTLDDGTGNATFTESVTMEGTLYFTATNSYISAAAGGTFTIEASNPTYGLNIKNTGTGNNGIYQLFTSVPGPTAQLGVTYQGNLLVKPSATSGSAIIFGPITTNTYSCGGSSYLWTAVYATNGTIQTSDHNLKKDIEELKFSAGNIVRSLRAKQFRWDNDKVKQMAANSDPEYDPERIFKEDNRTYFGFMAQEIDSAMKKEGVEAYDGLLHAPKTGMNDSDHWLYNPVNMIPIMWEAIYDIQKRLDKIADLI